MDQQHATLSKDKRQDGGMFGKIKKSIYGPEYYQEILKKDSAYSWRYFFLFSLLVSALAAIVYSAMILPPAYVFAKKFVAEAVEKYPADLEITVEKGVVQTNAEQPYIVPSSLLGMGDDDRESLPKNLIVIDTQHDFAIDSLRTYDTLALLTRDSLAYRDGEKISIQSLEKIDQFALNKGVIEDFARKAEPYVKIMLPLSVLVIFLGLLLVAIGKVGYLLFGALLIWGILRARRIAVDYKKSYQIGLHLMTLPTILTFFPLGIGRFPFMYSVILIVVTLINFNGLEKIASEEKVEDELEDVVPGTPAVAIAKIE